MWNACYCIGRKTLIFFALSTVHFVTGSSSEYDFERSKGWLRVCGSNNVNQSALNVPSHYEVEAETCPYGSWLLENSHLGCVCINGVWAISQSLCDEDYFVAYGKGDCFNLDMPIRKLTFLGNPENALEHTNFVTAGNGHVFRSFSKEFTMSHEFPRTANLSTIFRLRPYKGTGVLLKVKQKVTWADENMMKIKQLQKLDDEIIVTNEGPICLDTDLNNGWEEEALVIYKVKAAITKIKGVQQCLKPLYSYNEFDYSFNRDKHVTEYKILPGQIIHVKSGNILQATQNCKSDCTFDSTTEPDEDDSKLNEFSKPIRNKREVLTRLELDWVYTPEDRDEIVRTANFRIAKQELNWLLEGIRPPTLKSENWKLAQKIKEVFKKACPNEVTPKFIVDAMMRLFRLIYLNSKEFYPNAYTIEESAQIERMTNTLDICLKDTSEFKFNYELIINHNEKNNCRKGIEEDANSTYCPCTEQLANVSISYADNITGPVEERTVMGENLHLTENLVFRLPNDTNVNSTFHDFPTETMWKVIMFTHFYCAKYFKRNPADFSTLMSKMEDFFNEDILYRWTHPGATSFKILQYLYTAFDLKKFAKSVDTCVAISKLVSVYPEWLNRPTLERRKKRSVDTKSFWRGSAYCLNDSNDDGYMEVAAQNKCFRLNKR